MPVHERAEIEYQLTKRTTLRKGDVVTFHGGGPEYTGDDGQVHRIPLRGKFLIRSILHRGAKVYLDVCEADVIKSLMDGRNRLVVNAYGGRRLAFIGGRAFRSRLSDLLHRPYRVKKLKGVAL